MKATSESALDYCNHIRSVDYSWRYKSSLFDQRLFVVGLIQYLLEYEPYSQSLESKPDIFTKQYAGCLDASASDYLGAIRRQTASFIDDYLLNLSHELSAEFADTEDANEIWNKNSDLLAMICEWSSLDYSELKAACQEECSKSEGNWFTRFTWAEATLFSKNLAQIGLSLDMNEQMISNEPWNVYQDGYVPDIYPWAEPDSIRFRNDSIKNQQVSYILPIIYPWHDINVAKE